MKRRGEVTTALIIAILAALGIGYGYYAWKSQQGTSGNMHGSEDSKQAQEVVKVNALAQEIKSELSSKFGEFSIIESYDFVPSVKMKWGDKSVDQAGDRYCFVIPEEFVHKFSSLAADGTLAVARDGSKFSINIRNGKDFNLEETLSELLHQVSDLKSGGFSNHVDISTVESEIAKQFTGKSAESYGYVRFIFKTNVDDVYVVAVFSIDPNEITHSKGRYIATGRELLIARTRDEILDGMKKEMDFDQDFYTLEFGLNTSSAINSNSSVEECLKKFIIQLEE